MFDVDFTTTACIRPEILEYTYKSFSKNLLGMSLKDYILYINIDPLPEKTQNSVSSVIAIAEKYFGKVVPHMPIKPNFCEAVKWIWSQVKSKYVFHLEDDWQLLAPIDLNDILKRFRKNSGLYQVRLNKNPQKKSATRLYGLSPCICRKEFCHIVASHLNPKRNPERQLRNVREWGLSQPSKDRVKAYPSNKTIIKDIGRDWRIAHGMSKEINENKFIKWKYMKRIEK